MHEPLKIDIGEVHGSWIWRGKSIANIRVWAKQRGERLVRYRYIRRFLDLTLTQEVEETSHGVMPESFFNNLRGTGHEHFINDGMEDP